MADAVRASPEGAAAAADPLLDPTYPKLCLHALFRIQARRTPDAVAIVVGPSSSSSSSSSTSTSTTGSANASITYAALDEASDRLAAALLRHGVTKNDPVGILMNRRAEYVLAYVAILKAGGGYAVLDPAYPDGLLADVLRTSNPKVVVTTREHVHRLPETQSAITLRSEWEDCLDVLTDADRDALDAVDCTDLDSLAYIVFSSGTTGQPKGIACPHRGAVFSYHRRHHDVPYKNGVDDAAAAAASSSTTTSASTSTTVSASCETVDCSSSDGSYAVVGAGQETEACNVFFVWEMLRPLLRGQRIAVIPDDTIYDVGRLTSFLQTVGATRMLFTPSLLEAVLDSHGTVSSEELARRLHSLTTIILCGEVVTVALHTRIRTVLPHARIINLYSVSECHDVAHVDLTHGDYAGRKYCPVGKLFPGVEAHVLDDDLNELAPGEVGELYVAGPTLALRYVNQPDVTAARFPTINGKRMYKTGDRAVVLPNRELEILGRCDSMVKIRGYSVELRAIEAALLTLPDTPVTSCVVVAQGEEGEDKFVVAYVVLAGGSACRDVRMALKSHLPHYMIPAYFVELSQMPRHEVSGKLDFKGLPKVNTKTGKAVGPGVKNGDNALSTGSDTTSPRTDSERTLHVIWCKILGMPQIDVIYDSFFDCGGHSLLAARLVQDISDKFSKSVGVADLYAHSTIEALAKFIGGDEEAQTEMEHALDLEAEVELFDTVKALDDIAMRAFWRTARYQVRMRSALITGATGWLGSYLLYELLTATDVDVVYCIIRPSTDETVTPLDRVKASLEGRGLWRDGFPERVRAFAGDASLHHLGLDEDDYAALSMSVDLVLHCAAQVNLVYPYEGLRSANVIGTANMLDFAARGKMKRFGYISSNGVFPECGLKDCREDADLALVCKDIKTGYGQSKWVAERLVQLAAGRGLPVVTFRPGNMGGDTGERGGNQSFNPNDFNHLVLTGSINLGAAPDVEGWIMEMTPVDIAAHAIIGILQDNSNLGKTYHVTNFQNCLTASQYFDAIRKKGHAMEQLSWDEWTTRLSESSNPYLNKLKGAIVGSSPEDLTTLSTFNNDIFLGECAKMGITIPKISQATMEHYVDLWQKEGVTSALPQLGSRPLSGKVVLITGASSGIGAAIAEALAGAGASVAIGGRRIDRLKELATTITTKTGSKIFPCQVDVTVRDEVKKFVVSSESALGPCDAFVNNAGVMHYTRLERGFEDLWEKEVDVNCKGLLHGIGAVLPGMIARGRGHFVATSSDAGRKVFPGLSVYSASKFFVEATCQGLRLETADKGVKVTTIQPGDCKTELTTVAPDADSHAEFAQPSKDRSVWLDPQDVAQAVLYAVSAPDHVGINEVLIEPRGAPA